MVKHYTLAVVLAATIASNARAADLAPVSWTHTASGTEVYVAAFWLTQFPRRAETEKHLLIAVPKPTWQGMTDTQRTRFHGFIRNALAGDIEMSKAEVQALRDQLANNDIYLLITDDPIGTLHARGVYAPVEDELP